MRDQDLLDDDQIAEVGSGLLQLTPGQAYRLADAPATVDLYPKAPSITRH
jgi:hypothetical protein